MPGTFDTLFDDDAPMGVFGGYRPQFQNALGKLAGNARSFGSVMPVTENPAGPGADSDDAGDNLDLGNSPADNVVDVSYRPLPPQQQAQNVAAARDAMSNPEVFAFMQAISAGEGDYNVLHGGARFSGWSYPKAGLAAGAYQIEPTTYDGLRNELGLDDFSPDTQDVMAARLIIEKGALPYILNGNLGDAIKRLRGTWPSLPSGLQSNTDMTKFLARYRSYLNAINGAPG